MDQPTRPALQLVVPLLTALALTAFVLLNLDGRQGLLQLAMWLVGAGWLLNLTVIAANGDVIHIRRAGSLSMGDLLLSAGVVLLIVLAMRSAPGRQPPGRLADRHWTDRAESRPHVAGMLKR
jgi:hypothetical protein